MIKNSLTGPPPDIPDNTAICGFHTNQPVEISQALRDCHAAEPAQKWNFYPKNARRMARKMAKEQSGPALPAQIALGGSGKRRRQAFGKACQSPKT